MSEREDRDEDLEALGLALRRLPTPMPPATLVAEVQRRGHLELAGRADEQLNRLVVGFVIFFAWTVNVFAFAAFRVLSGLFRIGSGSAWSWSAGYFVAAWFSGVAVLILVGIHVRRERGLA